MPIWSLLMAVTIAAQSVPTVDGVPAPTAAMAAATANKSRMKISPRFVDGPHAGFPEAARAAGAFGKVVVYGIIGIDGRFSELVVRESSRSAVLDAAAMSAAAASRFEPARDDAGTPLAVPVRMPFEFSNAKSPGKGGGVLRYDCAQFARDYDWWAANWSPTDRKDDFYLLVLGFSTIGKMYGRDGKLDPSLLGKVNLDFASRWQAAVENCRRSPTRLFIDVFKPEGDLMRRSAGG